jgi:hypothetical protein
VFFMYTLHDRLRENKTSKRRHKIISKKGPAVVDKCRRLQHNNRRVIVVAVTIQLTLSFTPSVSLTPATHV